MSIINQYSYLFLSLTVVVAVPVVLRRWRHVRWSVIVPVVVVLVALFTSAFFVLRPGAADVDDYVMAQTTINNGKPTLVEFYSNYCAGCLSVRPVVDALVNDIKDSFPDEFDVMRVDIHTPTGRRLREMYGFSFTPEFVLFDRTGLEVWRSHLPPSTVEIERLATADIAAAPE